MKRRHLFTLIFLIVYSFVNAEAGFYNSGGLKLIDNNGNNATNSAITVSSYNTTDTNLINSNINNIDKRWERVWKIKNTSNNKQNIDLVFVFSNAGYGKVANNAKNYVVLDSSGGSFKKEINQANVINSNKVRFNKFKIKKSSTFYITLATKDMNKSPLPVELVNFEADKIKNNIQLNWKTASETNNSHFIIQRKIDNTKWKNIGKVWGQGTTTLSTNYKFTVYDDVNKILYYRLKQVDFDNSFEFSNIVVVNNRKRQISKSTKIWISNDHYLIYRNGEKILKKR